MTLQTTTQTKQTTIATSEMKATFLVTVELGEGDTLLDSAREIFDIVESNFTVHEVKPWKRKSAPAEAQRGPASGVMPLNSTPQQT
jgi:hypothetical protein